MKPKQAKKDGVYPPRDLRTPYAVQLCGSDYLARSHFPKTKKIQIQMQLFRCNARMQIVLARAYIAALCRIRNCTQPCSHKTKS